VSAKVTTTTQTTTTENNLIIEFPNFEVFDINKPIVLHFHVFNSNATPVTNITTKCGIHTYDQSSHIEISNLTFDNTYDFEHSLNLSKYTTGIYSYIMQCNGTQDGMVSTSFELTSTGKVEDKSTRPLFLYFVIGLSLLLLIIGFNIEDKSMIAISGAIMTITGGWVVLNGFGDLNNNISAAIGIIMAILGSYVFLRSVLDDTISELNNLR
jgi:hypothetical protein